MSQGLLAELNARPLPSWYDEAKFGIFIHWGMWAIPGFAPRVGDIGEASDRDYDRALVNTPYTEWYWNALRAGDTPTAAFHREHYGDAPYEAFRHPFLAGLHAWDPASWAETFRDAGARYVVLVTKHHDGFCLWPSGVSNPHERNWTSPRDLVGELATAVRAAGLRFGVYYSGGLDWTFNREPILTIADMLGSVPDGAYPDYAEAQTRELIARYEPSVLWNDIAWPTDEDRLFRLFADYCAAVPEGVVNDRWGTPTSLTEALRASPETRRSLDERLKAARAASRAAGEGGGIVPPPVPHSDFRTPEYAAFDSIQAKKWEATRGMSHSFGFNRNDSEDDYASAETLLGGLIDGAARNGNLLLNVGPRPDGSIPRPQLDRLRAMGAWLTSNGAAIYGAKPCTGSDGVTTDGAEVRFTRGPDTVNLIVKGRRTGERLVIRDLEIEGSARLLSDGSPVGLEHVGDDLALTFARPLAGDFAPVVAVTVA